ncbi:hypothetical protein HC752_21745 [Vibrio sp. S9_S30]|uniref:hypothetical protein n=1 Tax=Vibrio sp. S9_S30 TaxID=2720226 RepID=UPI001681C1E8|nr:hypothetical protein [Vibrio sp. S9_S30]MBD1559570.1 hypothetical protein [Vibrio sp. S9_S30]
MSFEATEHLQGPEIKSQQLAAVAVAAGEAAEHVDRQTLALCFQVIERLARETTEHIKMTESYLNY